MPLTKNRRLLKFSNNSRGNGPARGDREDGYLACALCNKVIRSDEEAIEMCADILSVDYRGEDLQSQPYWDPQAWRLVSGKTPKGRAAKVLATEWLPVQVTYQDNSGSIWVNVVYLTPAARLDPKQPGESFDALLDRAQESLSDTSD